MTRKIDTPAKAKLAIRPQTRRWKRLLEDANDESVQAKHNRTILREHLEAADRLAERRHQLTKRIKLDTDVSFTDEPTQPWATDAQWNTRADVLRQFASDPNEHMAHILAPFLPAQLGDLRSALVSVAADAIVVASHYFTPEQATTLFQCACDGVAITKQVSAEARRRAGLSVLEPHQNIELWNTVTSNLESEQTAPRVLVVDAVTAYVKRENMDESHVSEVSGTVLNIAAMDRTADVRNASKQLWAAVQAKSSEFELAVKSRLQADVLKRLTVSTTNSRPAKGKLAKNGNNKKSMKELLRERREAMKRERQMAAESKMEIDSGSHCENNTDQTAKVESEKPVVRPKRSTRIRGQENITP